MSNLSGTARLTALLLGLLALGPSEGLAKKASDTVSGRAQVRSGDVIMVGRQEVHLWGIDAADLHQPCSPAKVLTCGEYARITLQQMVTGRRITCRIKERPAYVVYVVAVCKLREHGRTTDLGKEMVKLGHAYALTDDGKGAYARYQLRIMPFKRPSDWRELQENDVRRGNAHH
jgi:endonuclease YncB( thermonuclease family)